MIHRDVNKITDEMFGSVAEYLRAEMLGDLTINAAYVISIRNVRNGTDIDGGNVKTATNMQVSKDFVYRYFYPVFNRSNILLTELQDVDFDPYIQQIDEICEQVKYLEKVTAELDEYSKHLELRLKKISK
ncbi:10957_t:CDS:2 [Paraglomus brasilianum]|uniref:10957_t:CDS:1 n=1 Tax=Paraglomus brasilianum TaxID=144538 RepID=A0A9N9A8D4_9GLOM|nr:10957_t:CDS:2 [Paraglomus brasilianum]